MKDNGEIVGGVDAIDVTIRGGFRAAKLALEQGIERPLDIERSERTSIVELNARMQVEDVSERIGNLPALRQSRLDVEMVVARQQRVEEKFVNALGLPVDAHSRVQIRGAALNNHDQRVGVGRLRAGEKREEQSANGQENSYPSKKDCHPERSEGPRSLVLLPSPLTHTRSSPELPPASLP